LPKPDSAEYCGGDVKVEAGFSHETAPYWKWKQSEERKERQPFTNKRGEEREAEM